MPDPVGRAEPYLILIPFVAGVAAAQVDNTPYSVCLHVMFKLVVAGLGAPVRFPRCHRMKVAVAEDEQIISSRN